MKKIPATLLLCLLLQPLFAQQQRKISLYLSAQADKTLQDVTRENNTAGFGPALQVFMNNKTRFKPLLELNAALYGGTKDLLTYNGIPLESVLIMVNVHAGASYHPLKYAYVSLTAGPAFVSDQVLPGIRSSIGFYFPKNQKLTARLSYLHVFNRGNVIREDFSAVSVGFGFKLF